MIRDTLLAMLDGATVANAAMPWGKPGPIRLPDDPDARAALADAHLKGGPADVAYCPQGRSPERMHVESLALAGFCPAGDGRCGWLGIDLDGPDHGAGGLADPAHAARYIAERADAAGVLGGLLTARSRGGQGRHIFLLPPEPIPLADGVLAVAALAAQAFKVARADVDDHGAAHAFKCADGRIASPGQPGAVELIPRGTARPALGWPLALPTGKRIIDPFTDKRIELTAVPCCDGEAWSRFLTDARTMLPRRMPDKAASRPASERYRARGYVGTAPRALDARTRDFLAGRVSQGSRNIAAFAAACNLLGSGVPEHEAERLILAGAAACGLAEREARTAFASAVGALRRRGRR